MNFADSAQIYAQYLKHPRLRIDSREVTAGDFFCGIKGTRTDGNQYAAAALERGAGCVLVDDPSVVIGADERYLLVADTLTAIQELALSHRKKFGMPVLAITGSNGKTTTKELIVSVMSRQYRVHATPGNYNNHLGLPLTILGMPPGTELLILEMGANRLGDIAELCTIGRPTHGLITNVGEAHLEGFGSAEGVRAGKGELFSWLAKHGGVAFVNRDEPYLSEMSRQVARVIPYVTSEKPSKEEPALEIRVDAVHPSCRVGFLSEHRRLLSAEVALGGEHNLQNVKTAIAVGKYFKVPGKLIAAALKQFQPTNHRSQWMSHREVRFYWDAYNANPTSVEASLGGFAAEVSPNSAVVILGEMLELGPAAPAAHRRVALRAGQVARTVLLVGESMKETAREFDRPHFADSSELADWFWKQDWKGKSVFVKGSRGNRLERLL